ncbi:MULTISPECIES: hypothetical protein [unclassified Mucilaginibacter]|uniref:hypothetical protein n=1 Tax=unclassified Mucilaginibacter TaxID=2617802 RepID=UPI002AC93520|nr:MULTISPECIES: hypothetical protein [unclassified Mucilaginibacter]MEB0263104.1 hypothetical protein [Mucilaginibacter sp. 10I4]MEB0277760.1 hypothetical protein [Mucilaginibacter sp. 10B2]MEB0301918.1 hypothetical protein [Mucilaginibacter sp. 5C4]WPX24615.1 hypothetical protein RHM67_04925 [Mucilaginibacter sp. 5C4]
MLHRLTAYLLIVSLVSANFSRFFIYAGFELNRNYIATKLCENRNKPQLHCNGKCYFMKKVKQAEEKQNTEDRQAQKNLFQEASYNQPAQVKFYSVLLSVTKVPNYRFQLPQQPANIFQPPRLA